MEIGGRSGYEYFKEDDNYLYTIAQFFPRMAVYSDVTDGKTSSFWVEESLLFRLAIMM